MITCQWKCSPAEVGVVQRVWLVALLGAIVLAGIAAATVDPVQKVVLPASYKAEKIAEVQEKLRALREGRVFWEIEAEKLRRLRDIEESLAAAAFMEGGMPEAEAELRAREYVEGLMSTNDFIVAHIKARIAELENRLASIQGVMAQ